MGSVGDNLDSTAGTDTFPWNVIELIGFMENLVKDNHLAYQISATWTQT